MNIDRMEFIAWMERIMQRFDIMGENIRDQKKNRASIDGEELLDNQDVLQLLKVGMRSLQRYRSDGRLTYYTISGKLYYKHSDVQQFLRECLKGPRRKAADTEGKTKPARDRDNEIRRENNSFGKDNQNGTE